jgi:hypothetical protein
MGFGLKSTRLEMRAKGRNTQVDLTDEGAALKIRASYRRHAQKVRSR